jgi:hypothetical protein
LLIKALLVYKLLKVAKFALIIFMFAAVLWSGNAKVFKTAHIFGVIGVTVKNPKGWLIVYALQLGPSRKFNPFVVLTIIPRLVEARP